MQKITYFAKVYYLLCVFVAIALTCWCMYEYHLDNDVTDIILHKFHDTPNDILPSITLCDTDPFNEHTMHSTGDWNAIITDYMYLINGDQKRFNESLDPTDSFGILHKNPKAIKNYVEMLNTIDYDSVTVSLKNFISDFFIQIPFDSEINYSSRYDVIEHSLVVNKIDKETQKDSFLEPMEYVNTYVSARTGGYKCFTFDVPMIPKRDIRQIRMQVNVSRSIMGLDLSQFYFMLTFPKQTLQVSRGNQIYLNRHHSKRPQCYKFDVHVGAMEVFRTRDKSSNRCNVDWRHHDDEHLNAIINLIGCNPNHWQLSSHVPNCSSAKQYYEIDQMLSKKDGFMPPCRRIATISKITKGTNPEHLCLTNSYLDLRFYLDEETFYKEIVLVPAYTFQSLIGNAGNLTFIYI